METAVSSVQKEGLTQPTLRRQNACRSLTEWICSWSANTGWCFGPRGRNSSQGTEAQARLISANLTILAREMEGEGEDEKGRGREGQERGRERREEGGRGERKRTQL